MRTYDISASGSSTGSRFYTSNITIFITVFIFLVIFFITINTSIFTELISHQYDDTCRLKKEAKEPARSILPFFGVSGSAHGTHPALLQKIPVRKSLCVGTIHGPSTSFSLTVRSCLCYCCSSRAPPTDRLTPRRARAQRSLAESQHGVPKGQALC
ncbi:Hypothetical predicted protein [Xyrichtys novacula]|uniref:Uncharacterized protein n=1 Tax=Xyrichtys novacula TaxID=13765 RepID=A0AAV1FWE0_XYRNO|nr:Hypothetical predicted protein [Xyrichtys novacula]